MESKRSSLNEKEVTRKILLRLRQGMESTEHRQLSDMVYKNVVSFVESKFGNRKHLSIGLYYPIKSEVDTLDILKYCLSNGWSVYLPKITVNDKSKNPKNEMNYVKFKSFDNLISGPYNIKEPKSNRSTKRLHIIFVPGLAFDRKGNRIGYGKGYFDRYLKKARQYSKNILFVGLCFDFQIVNPIKTHEHDVKMDYIITENEIITTKNNKRR